MSTVIFEEGMVVRRVDLARLLGITERHISRLAKEGLFTKKGNKYYLVENVTAYMDYLKSASSGDEDLKDLKLKKEIEKLTKDVELKEIKIQEARNELHNSDVVREVMTAMLLNLKGKLLSVPNKVAPLAIGMDNLEDIQSLVLGEVQDCLEEISGYTPDLFKNKNAVDEEDEENEEESQKTTKRKRKTKKKDS